MLGFCDNGDEFLGSVIIHLQGRPQNLFCLRELS